MAGPGNGRGGRLLAVVGQDPLLAYYVRQSVCRGGPVLVLGSGNGRLVWELARVGLGTVAVDPSARMVASAEELRLGQPAEVAARVRLLAADLRVLRLSERFPLVLAPQNALGLAGSQESLEAVLVTAVHHLAQGGELLFDVPNPRPQALSPTEEAWHPLGGIEPPRPAFAPHLRERHRGRGGEGIHRLRLRQFSVEELDQCLKATGLVAQERYGGFDERPFEPAHPLQVVVARQG
jgi:SAM-dependent methyltransferase